MAFGEFQFHNDFDRFVSCVWGSRAPAARAE